MARADPAVRPVGARRADGRGGLQVVPGRAVAGDTAAVRRELRRLLAAAAAGGDGERGVDAVYAAVKAGALGPPEHVLGWLHEARYDVDRRAAFARARGGAAPIDAAGVVAASRVYTPDHIVAFLLENSLGAWWAEAHPHSTLADAWPYLVTAALRSGRPAKPLRDLSLLDPCCGCGAFLLPAFDMLVAMYAEERRLAAAGLIPTDWPTPPEAVGRTILQRNLAGADLDTAAVAIASELLAARGGTPAQIGVPDLPIGSLARAAWGGRRFDIIVANPPYVGFRMLDAAVKTQLRDEDPRARSDLAVAFQSLCVDLLAHGGLCATVTPAAWLTSSEALGLRQAILAEGGPRVAVALGQRVFDQAPLLFTGLCVVERGIRPPQLRVLRPATGSGPGGLRQAARDGGIGVAAAAVDRLRLRPFLPAAPEPVLALAGRGPRLGDLFDATDGVWTGDNARDTRLWWEVADPDGWVRLSGGQGNAPWAAPIRLRIRAAHADSTDRIGVEYARVAGGRLAARRCEAGTAALAGVVTLSPRDREGLARIEEVLAIFNSRIGVAWLQTLSSGLNFNPGYAAEIPLGRDAPPTQLTNLVRELMGMRAAIAARDLTADTFTATRAPWHHDALAAAISDAERACELLLAEHLGLTRDTLDQLPPVRRNRSRDDPLDDYLMERALRALGFRWPGERRGEPRPPMTATQLAAGIRDALDGEGAPTDLDVPAWVERRFLAAHTRRFRGRPVVERLASPTRFRIGHARRDPTRVP